MLLFFLGCDPSIMGIGPAPAIRSMLKANGLSLDDIGLVEVSSREIVNFDCISLLVEYVVHGRAW